MFPFCIHRGTRSLFQTLVLNILAFSSLLLSKTTKVVSCVYIILQLVVHTHAELEGHASHLRTDMPRLLVLVRSTPVRASPLPGGVFRSRCQRVKGSGRYLPAGGGGGGLRAAVRTQRGERRLQVTSIHQSPVSTGGRGRAAEEPTRRERRTRRAAQLQEQPGCKDLGGNCCPEVLS